MSLRVKKDDTQQRRPRLNYDVLIAKAQKRINGLEKEKPVRPPEYEAARPDHLYKTEAIAMRRLYSELVRKQEHHVDPDSFDLVSG